MLREIFATVAATTLASGTVVVISEALNSSESEQTPTQSSACWHSAQDKGCDDNTYINQQRRAADGEDD
ncbi:MAG: hypothetical protein EAZ74_02030 [Alphaproteobacteria bacterium]|nr:MAG: hypothetical protein EAZ74_02030 [Alphaproteobacteria bacterium]TAF74980.1 MAG: hypothetical protein EAZ52_07560 [Alphaproteobacteria bacterium]